MRRGRWFAWSIAVVLLGCSDEAAETSGTGAGAQGGAGAGGSEPDPEGNPEGGAGQAPSSYGLAVQWEIEAGAASPSLSQVEDSGHDWATGPSGEVLFLRREQAEGPLSELHLYRLGSDGAPVGGWWPLVVAVPYLAEAPATAAIHQDGSVFVAALAQDAWVTTKIGANGAVVYQKHLFMGAGAAPKALRLDSTGGVVVVGTTGASLDQGIGNDCMVHRYDAAGESDDAFTQVFDATGDDSGCSTLAITSGGDVIFGGADMLAKRAWMGGLSASGAALGEFVRDGDYFLSLAPGPVSGALAMHRSASGAHVSVVTGVTLGESLLEVDDKTVLRVAASVNAPLAAAVRYPNEDLEAPVRVDWLAPSGAGYALAGGGEVDGPARIFDGANVTVLPAPDGGLVLRRWVSDGGPLKVLVSRLAPAAP